MEYQGELTFSLSVFDTPGAPASPKQGKHLILRIWWSRKIKSGNSITKSFSERISMKHTCPRAPEELAWVVLDLPF